MKTVRLQDIRNRSVINHTPLGRDIQRIARETQPGLIRRRGFGWSDGGCWTFAAALARWSGGQLALAQVVSPAGVHRGYTDHIVAHYQGLLYLDADGLATGPELLDKWRRLEGIERQFYTLEPFADPEKAGMGGIIFVRAEMPGLMEHLRQVLGNFNTITRDALDELLEGMRAGGVPAPSLTQRSAP